MSLTITFMASHRRTGTVMPGRVDLNLQHSVVDPNEATPIARTCFIQKPRGLIFFCSFKTQMDAAPASRYANQFSVLLIPS